MKFGSLSSFDSLMEAILDVLIDTISDFGYNYRDIGVMSWWVGLVHVDVLLGLNSGWGLFRCLSPAWRGHVSASEVIGSSPAARGLIIVL